MRILLIDDDPELRAGLGAGLRQAGFGVDACADGADAEASLRRSAPIDLILLDVEMPGRSGFEVLEAMRAGGESTPVIFLTGKHELADRVRGLRGGADDYVVKPFELDEVLARIEAVLRRRRPRVVYEVGPIRFDLTARRALRGDRDLELSEREFDLVRVLLEADGATLTRPELMERAWGMRFDPGTNIVDVVVMRLRRKLDAGGGHAIRTVVGTGYAMDGRRVNA